MKINEQKTFWAAVEKKVSSRFIKQTSVIQNVD